MPLAGGGTRHPPPCEALTAQAVRDRALESTQSPWRDGASRWSDCGILFFTIPRGVSAVADLVGATAFLYPRLTPGLPLRVVPEDPEFRMDLRERDAGVGPAGLELGSAV